MKHPRAICPRCKREVALKASGRTIRHACLAADRYAVSAAQQPEQPVSFSVIYESKHGPTAYSHDPALDAYKYLSHAIRDGRGYQLLFNSDGSVTAAVDGLMPVTYERGN